ncbi:MAG TPA: diaminopimelate epimerase [Saprospiraceae bacterium]|nr:diaminopimelate epimerase [Saprospiraceae bacterium]
MEKFQDFIFYKYHGTGNDFIIMDQMHKPVDLPAEYIRKICHRRFGIGADGLMILRPSQKADFNMIYYNSDGKEGSMCGNGGRCISHLFFKKHQKGTPEIIFEAVDGLHTAHLLSDDRIKIQMIDVNEINIQTDFLEINTGSPHYVRRIDSIETWDVVKEGKKIRYSDRYSENGINVNFMEFSNGKIYIRTYERGVEDETLSCGTGAVACGIAAYLTGLSNGQTKIELITAGGVLCVDFSEREDRFVNIYLTGPATPVYTGKIHFA